MACSHCIKADFDVLKQCTKVELETDDITLLLSYFSDQDTSVLTRYIGLLQGRRILTEAEDPSLSFFEREVYSNDRYRYSTSTPQDLEIVRYANNPFRTLLYTLSMGSSHYHDMNYHRMFPELYVRPKFTTKSGYPDEMHSVCMGALSLRYLKPKAYTPFRVTDKREPGDQVFSLISESFCDHVGISTCKHGVALDCSICKTASYPAFKGLVNFTLRPHLLASTFLGDHCLLDYINYDFVSGKISTPVALRGLDIGLWKFSLDAALLLDKLMALGLFVPSEAILKNVGVHPTRPVSIHHPKPRSTIVGEPFFRTTPVIHRSWIEIASSCFRGISGEADFETGTFKEISDASPAYHAFNAIFTGSFNKNWQNVLRLHALYPASRSKYGAKGNQNWTRFVATLELACSSTAPESTSTFRSMLGNLAESPMWLRLHPDEDWRINCSTRGQTARHPLTHPCANASDLVLNRLTDQDWLSLFYALYHTTDFKDVIKALIYTPTEPNPEWLYHLTRVRVSNAMDHLDVSVKTREGGVLWDLLMQFGALELDQQVLAVNPLVMDTWFVPFPNNPAPQTVLPLQQGVLHRAFLHYDPEVVSVFSPYDYRRFHVTVQNPDESYASVRSDLPEAAREYFDKNPYICNSLTEFKFTRGLRNLKSVYLCDMLTLELDEIFRWLFVELIQEHGVFFSRCVSLIRSFVNDKLLLLSFSGQDSSYATVPPAVRKILLRGQFQEFLRVLKHFPGTPGGWQSRVELSTGKPSTYTAISDSTVLCLSDEKVSGVVDNSTTKRRLVNYYKLVDVLSLNQGLITPQSTGNVCDRLPFKSLSVAPDSEVSLLPSPDAFHSVISDALARRLKCAIISDYVPTRVDMPHCPLTSIDRGASHCDVNGALEHDIYAFMAYPYRPLAYSFYLCQVNWTPQESELDDPNAPVGNDLYLMRKTVVGLILSFQGVGATTPTRTGGHEGFAFSGSTLLSLILGTRRITPYINLNDGHRNRAHHKRGRTDPDSEDLSDSEEDTPYKRPRLTAEVNTTVNYPSEDEDDSLFVEESSEGDFVFF